MLNQRPIPAEIVAYCADNVACLPFHKGKGRDLVRDEAARRVANSQRKDCIPHGWEKALVPWRAKQNAKLDVLNGEDLYDETSWRDCVDDGDIGF